MAENTVPPSAGSAEILEELDAIIREEFLRGTSLLQALVRTLATMGDAELEESLKIATEHFDSARSRMEGAVLRLSRELRA